MKIRPTGSRLLIKVTEEPGTTKSGIHIPQNSFKKDVPHIAGVAGKGPNVRGTISIGDTIVFAKYSGELVKIDDGEYSFIDESDVLAVIKKEGV